MVKLKKQKIQVLRTVQFRARQERWNHKTLCELRGLGLVHSERTRSTIYTWTITIEGAAYLAAL